MKKLVFLIIMILASCSKSSEDANRDSIFAGSSDPTQADIIGVKNITAVASPMADASGNWEVALTWKQDESTFKFVYDVTRTITSGHYDTCISTSPTCDVQSYKNIKSGVIIPNLKAGSIQYFKVRVSLAGRPNILGVESEEYTVKVPIDSYTEKPGPFTVTATGGDGQVTLSWTDSKRATFYIIQRGPSTGSYPNPVKNLAKSPYVDKDLTNGVPLYYTVIAVNSVGSTNTTAEAFATPQAAPGSFGAVTLVPGDKTVTLSWGTSTGATRYTIRRATSESGPFELIKELAEGPYTDTALTNGTLYFYKVSAINSNGTAVEAATVNTTPFGLPGSFTVTPTAGDGKVILDWTSSTGASSYTVQFGTTTGSYPFTFSTTATNPIDVTDLTNGDTYYFRVIAVNSSGSTNAAEVSSTPIAVPGAFTVTPTAGDSKVTLSWGASTGAVTFTVEYGITSGSYLPFSSSATSPIDVTSLTNGTPYFFRVTAVNTSGITPAAEVSTTPAQASSGCTHNGDITLTDDSDVDAFNTEGCDHLNGSISAGVSTDVTTTIATMNFTNLKTITGNVTITANSSLSTISFPQLISVTGSFNTNQNYALTTFSLPSFTTVGSFFMFRDVSALTSFNISALHTVGATFSIDNIHGPSPLPLNLSALQTVSSSFSIYGSDFTGINLSSLATVSGLVQVVSNPSLLSCSVWNYFDTNPVAVTDTISINTNDESVTCGH